jgi:xylan 1,4-beta-xylosidase
MPAGRSGTADALAFVVPRFFCDWSDPVSSAPHVWEHTVGSDHAPMALRADWQRQLRRCRRELGIEHVRFHGILSDAMGTLTCEENELLYSFFNADQTFDYLLSIGVHPFVELSFMPQALASGSQSVFRYQGNITPPRDYGAWETLISRLVRHWLDRYGLAELQRWYFEVWNEPNLPAFWTGTQAEYFALYQRTVTAIKSVDASLQVGGPASAQNAWIDDFLQYCDTHGVPADFVSTHYYPTDAFSEIGADTRAQLAHAPRDVMLDRARTAACQSRRRPLFYTEWNLSSNPRDPLHDQPFAAAYATRVAMQVAEHVQGYSFWTFSDIFAENYFPSLPFHGGFGLLTLHGIPKPVYRAFQLLHRLGTKRSPTHGTHATVDTWVIRDERRAVILLTNHAQPQHDISTEQVEVEVMRMPEPHTAYIERIDDDHANAQKAWIEMGRPEYLTRSQVHELHLASSVIKEPISWTGVDGSIRFHLDLPPHAVAAITVESSPGDPSHAAGRS